MSALGPLGHQDGLFVSTSQSLLLHLLLHLLSVVSFRVCLHQQRAECLQGSNMALNLGKNRLALLTAYQDVIDESSDTDW